jgi:hypothetical protein
VPALLRTMVMVLSSLAFPLIFFECRPADAAPGRALHPSHAK